jgi:5-methylcytosine-specific restriction endonuclease McrA
MEVKCDNCGDVFDKQPAKVEKTNRDFCSLDCYHDFGHEGNTSDEDVRVEKTCDTCDETYKVYPYRADESRYCSRECADKGDYHLEGEEHGRWSGGPETHTCQNCGDSFERYPRKNDSKYCSRECFREASEGMFSGEGNPAWRGGWHHYYGANWDEQRAAAIERDDNTCQDCGVSGDELDRSLDVHHKKRIGWFREEYDAPEWWERANRLENLVSLCSSCHKKREWSKAD